MPGSWSPLPLITNKQQQHSSLPLSLPKKVKKSVSFGTQSKESSTIFVRRWISVSREEWAADEVGDNGNDLDGGVEVGGVAGAAWGWRKGEGIGCVFGGVVVERAVCTGDVEMEDV